MDIVEERQEFMVDFNGDQTPNLRTAHFIKPTLPPFSLVPPPPKIQSLSFSTKPRVNFIGSPPPEKSWLTWFEKLQPTHEAVWRKGGIFDAIKASTCVIVRQRDLLLSLGEKWCPETNTFVFSWGEATVTLEDVMVLGGFSPLGESFLSSCSLGQNVERLVDSLMKCKREIARNSKHNRHVSQNAWIEYFTGRGYELEPEVEHAAFFAHWLSRHVFPTQGRNSIRTLVFSLAARLSTGIRIALAPAILATIYRGLRLLKEKLVQSSDCVDDLDSLKLVEPLHLVQLWVWERFPMLAPVLRMINPGEPRTARWKCLSKSYISSVGLKMGLESARESFRWRPYATFIENWSIPCFYDDVGKCVSVESDEKWELFACCLKVCQLESLDDLEDYNPHRVAMQFGFDQRIPCFIPRSLELNSGNSDGLDTFTKLYLPPRLFQGGVNMKYSDWWKGKKVSRESAPLRVYSRRKRTSSNVERPLCVFGTDLHKNLGIAAEPSNSPVECNMVENGDLGANVGQKPVGTSSNIERPLCDLGTGLHKNLGVAAEPSSSPVDSNMVEHGDLGDNVGQKPVVILRNCKQRSVSYHCETERRRSKRIAKNRFQNSNVYVGQHCILTTVTTESSFLNSVGETLIETSSSNKSNRKVEDKSGATPHLLCNTSMDSELCASADEMCIETAPCLDKNTSPTENNVDDCEDLSENVDVNGDDRTKGAAHEKRPPPSSYNVVNSENVPCPSVKKVKFDNHGKNKTTKAPPCLPSMYGNHIQDMDTGTTPLLDTRTNHESASAPLQSCSQSANAHFLEPNFTNPNKALPKPPSLYPSRFMIFEQKRELMVPPTTTPTGVHPSPIKRNAHFLRPIFNPKQTPPKPPSLSLIRNPSIDQFKGIVAFKGWQGPQKNWDNWVSNMQQTHLEIWKKVGIFDAIRASTYNIKRHNELIIGLADKWCPETNTFVFSFGEATITLEVVLILGGFSVLGECVLTPVRNQEFEEIKKGMLNVFKRKRECTNPLVVHSEWMSHFMGVGGELEHTAFLVLWLSRYVFSSKCYGYISPCVFPIAISLARGSRIALAPAVLAAIYRDLRLLKAKIIEFMNDGVEDCSNLQLWAPFQLVQLWIWERFPMLAPEPALIPGGEPRLARWQNLDRVKARYLRFDFVPIDGVFVWRPYAVCVENWHIPEFYSNEEMMVLLDSEDGMELLSFAICLRPCELVGVDCIEQYLPHRVGMQFGMDQHIPSTVSRLDQSPKVAWRSYDEPFDGVMLYVPPKSLKGDVTVQYFDWWRSASYKKGENGSKANSDEVPSWMNSVSGAAKNSGGMNLVNAAAEVPGRMDSVSVAAEVAGRMNSETTQGKNKTETGVNMKPGSTGKTSSEHSLAKSRKESPTPVSNVVSEVERLQQEQKKLSCAGASRVTVGVQQGITPENGSLYDPLVIGDDMVNNNDEDDELNNIINGFEQQNSEFEHRIREVEAMISGFQKSYA